MANASRRQALTMGLVVSGVLGTLGRAFGQQSGAGGKGRNRPLSQGGTIATVKLDAAMQTSTKSLALNKKVMAEYAVLNLALEKLQSEAVKVDAKLFSMRIEVGRDKERAELTSKGKQLALEYEAGRKKAEADIARMQIEGACVLYKEVKRFAAEIAKDRGFLLVVYFNDKSPLDGGNKLVVNKPEDAYGFLSQPILFADPSTDITSEIIARLDAVSVF